jgi:hypothetical protein
MMDKLGDKAILIRREWEKRKARSRRFAFNV